MSDDFTLTSHPPGRRRRHSAPAQAGPGCCCCCCCCLHTVGSVVGAIVGPKFGNKPKEWSHLALMDYWEDEEFKPGFTHPANVNPEAITEDAPAPLPERRETPRYDP